MLSQTLFEIEHEKLHHYSASTAMRYHLQVELARLERRRDTLKTLLGV
jgi:hypothetical protein